METLFALVIFTHLSGDPEEYQILNIYDRALACQDAQEDFLAVEQREDREEARIGKHVSADMRASWHERIACVAMPSSSPCVTVMQNSSCAARGNEAFNEAYPACRKALHLEGELPTPKPCR
jgi:hypothetical protein